MARHARRSTLHTPSSWAGRPGPPSRTASNRPIAGSWSVWTPSAPWTSRELATAHRTRDPGRRSRRGGAVLLGAQLGRVSGQMATLVVLARLLPPAAFGLLAMVAAIGVVL